MSAIRDANLAPVPEFDTRIKERHARGKRRLALFLAATLFSVLSLGTLIASIVNDAFGYVLLENTVEPETLAPGGNFAALDKVELVEILRANVSRRFLMKLDSDAPLADRPKDDLIDLVRTEVVDPVVKKTWNLSDSLLHGKGIVAWAAQNSPKGHVEFRSWLNADFVRRSQASVAIDAGVRGAAFGSFLTILITILFAFPIGIGAAIYLEEYAGDTRLNRIIQTNIYNLAGVPSIIYGMLGLAIFVRGMEPITSGALFGAVADPSTANGRTIFSAGLTLALLILPVIIINAQEALRAVPASLRYSSYAVGATRWQTIWHHVLPASMDRILTGTVLAVSRAVGETAPLVVVGAPAFLTQDPTGIFSKFTTLPIQIYQWTARPQAEFRNAAAAAILVLLALLMTLNASAILLRNHYRKNKRLG
ncbi:MAG: phosphate ABC transporter permease PstA [Treponemataceae bacterium]